MPLESVLAIPDYCVVMATGYASTDISEDVGHLADDPDVAGVPIVVVAFTALVTTYVVVLCGEDSDGPATDPAHFLTKGLLTEGWCATSPDVRSLEKLHA